MRLVLEFMSLAYVLILVYLVLTHGNAARGLLGGVFRGTQGTITVLQGRNPRRVL